MIKLHFLWEEDEGMTWTIGWLIFIAVCLLLELATVSLTTIWFAGGAIVACILAALGVPAYIQIIVFLIVSIVLLIFTRPLAMKYFNKNRTKTNVDSIAGKQAIVTKAINNLKAEGQVTLDGMEWTARTTEDGNNIPEGAVVTVVEVQGVKLIVEERKEGN